MGCAATTQQTVPSGTWPRSAVSRAAAGAGGPGLAIALVVDAVLPGRDAFIARLVAQTERDIVALEHDEQLSGLLEASISENIVAVLNVLKHSIDPASIEAPLSAISYARRLAQRDVPLAALLRAYRLGQAQFLNVCLAETMRLAESEHLAGAETAQTMIDLVNISTAYIDRVSEQVTLAYGAEREYWLQDQRVVRRHWTAHLLTATYPDITRAGAALGYRLGATHLAAKVWVDQPIDGPDAAGSLHEAAVLMERVLGGEGAPLVVPTDERDLQMWIPVPQHQPRRTDRLRAQLDHARLPVRVALGNPDPGLAGFRRSMREAARAKRLALAAGPGAPAVIDFCEVAPVALLTEEVEDLADFVLRTLNGLAGGGARGSRLRETLLTFLRHNRSYADAADAMGVHRNTVYYRVQRALEFYGRPLGADALDLHLALEVAHWRGTDIFPGNATTPQGEPFP